MLSEKREDAGFVFPSLLPDWLGRETRSGVFDALGVAPERSAGVTMFSESLPGRGRAEWSRLCAAREERA